MHWLDWRRWLVYTHRWLGIAGGVLFVAWFFSGVVMMYARMPGLANEERLARATALALSAATVSPLEAARAANVIDDDTASQAELTRPGTETTAPKRAAEISVARVRSLGLGSGNPSRSDPPGRPVAARVPLHAHHASRTGGVHELPVSEGNADVRRTAAYCLEKHEVSGLDLVRIDSLPFVILFLCLTRERRAVLSEHPLDEPAAIEPA
jgi:hypothetical protein